MKYKPCSASTCDIMKMTVKQLINPAPEPVWAWFFPFSTPILNLCTLAFHTKFGTRFWARFWARLRLWFGS